jgi:hypothetical protein
LTLPAATGAVCFYLEHHISLEPFDLQVVTDSGTSSGAVPVLAEIGPKYFGFYAAGGGEIHSLTISNLPGPFPGFAFGEIAIASSACGLTCPGDFDSDGVRSGLDLATLLGQWTGAGTYSPCPPRKQTDLNGDCKINGFDLALLLGAWGPCS